MCAVLITWYMYYALYGGAASDLAVAQDTGLFPTLQSCIGDMHLF